MMLPKKQLISFSIIISHQSVQYALHPLASALSWQVLRSSSILFTSNEKKPKKQPCISQFNIVISRADLALFNRLNLPFHVSSVCSFRLHTDRKSTRLNSSHVAISYAVFCLK